MKLTPVHPDKSYMEPVVVRSSNVAVDNAVSSDAAAANIICGANFIFLI